MSSNKHGDSHFAPDDEFLKKMEAYRQWLVDAEHQASQSYDKAAGSADLFFKVRGSCVREQQTAAELEKNSALPLLPGRHAGLPLRFP